MNTMCVCVCVSVGVGVCCVCVCVCCVRRERKCCLVLESKAGAYPMYPAPVVHTKDRLLALLDRGDSKKHKSFLLCGIIYGRKRFYSVGPGGEGPKVWVTTLKKKFYNICHR
jgi:hypothetical protein